MRETRKKKPMKRPPTQTGVKQSERERVDSEVSQKRGKRGILIALVCVLILAAAALAVIWWLNTREERFERSTLVIDREGSLTEKLKEDFPSGYKAEELKQKIEAEIEAAHAAADQQTKIKLEAFDVSKEEAFVQLKYPTVNDYELFYQTGLYVGEVDDEAYHQYAELAEQLKAYSGKQVVILTQPMDVRVPGKIIAVGSGYEQQGDHLAVLKQDALPPVYVIYE